MTVSSIAHALQTARELYLAGRLEEMEGICREILERDPANAEALNFLGQLAMRVGKHEVAAQIFAGTAELVPSSAACQFNLGQALAQLQRFTQAEQAYRRAIQLSPNSPESHTGLGLMLGRQKKFEQSLISLRQSLEILPRNAQAEFGVGWALKELQRWEEARAAFQRMLQIDPDNPQGNYALASALARLGRPDEALEFAARAVALNPTDIDWQNDYAVALRQVGRFDEAREHVRRLTVEFPQESAPHGFLGIMMLLQGDWRQGWEEYEWRWKCASFTTRRREFREPMWDGQDLNGRTILLWPEQGRGDLINFIRYAPLVAQRGGRVIISSPPELLPLVRRMEGVTMAVASTGALPPFDLHLPLLSLPRIFQTTPDTIPNKVPYLWPDEKRLALWKQRVGARDAGSPPGLRVGLVWAGSPGHVDDCHRSCRLADLSPLSGVANVRLYSLQKGRLMSEPTPPGMELIDFTSDLKDFADTAALIAQLDLVISVDTAVCHLAGAMGVPVWTMIQFSPDWRWMLNRQDTPWYPTMRLFRQPALRDWKSVIERIVIELREQTTRKDSSHDRVTQ